MDRLELATLPEPDTVNLAARLEAHTKVALRTILIDAATREALGDRLQIDCLGPVTFRGKAAPSEVFALAPAAAAGATGVSR